MGRLSKQEQSILLKTVLQKRNPSLVIILDRLGKVPLTSAEREQIQHAIGEELSASGIDDKGEINHYGLELDDLISLIAQTR